MANYSKGMARKICNAAARVKCISCKGRKRHPSCYGKCIICDGRGTITRQKAKLIRDYINQWCKCERTPVAFFELAGRQPMCEECGKPIEVG